MLSTQWQAGVFAGARRRYLMEACYVVMCYRNHLWRYLIEACNASSCAREINNVEMKHRFFSPRILISFFHFVSDLLVLFIHNFPCLSCIFPIVMQLVILGLSHNNGSIPFIS